MKLTAVFDAAWMLWVIVSCSFVVYTFFLIFNRKSPFGPPNTPPKVVANVVFGGGITGIESQIKMALVIVVVVVVVVVRVP